jgi:hypothetical protein
MKGLGAAPEEEEPDPPDTAGTHAGATLLLAVPLVGPPEDGATPEPAAEAPLDTVEAAPKEDPVPAEEGSAPADEETVPTDEESAALETGEDVALPAPVTPLLPSTPDPPWEALLGVPPSLGKSGLGRVPGVVPAHAVMPSARKAPLTNVRRVAPAASFLGS